MIPARLDLLYTTARFFPYVGGTEMHTLEVARRMAARGHRVTVLAADATGAQPPRQELDGMQVIRVPAWPRHRDYYVAPQLWHEVRRGSWSLVHCQGYHTAVAPISMAAARRQFPFVLSFHSGGHSSVLRRALRPIQLRALRPLLREARVLIGVSNFETRYFSSRLQIPHDRFMTIPNGTSLPQLEGARIGPVGTLLCSVGRLERYKGHHRVIAALPHLRRQVPDVRLKIVGRGPYEGELRRLVDRLGLGEVVEFVYVPADRRNDLTRLLHEAALVVLLSDYESHGMAVYEALALGRRVLVSDRAALAELAGEPGVRAVSTSVGSGELADAIFQVLLQPETGTSVRELPHWDEIADRLEELYHRVAT